LIHSFLGLSGFFIKFILGFHFGLERILEVLDFGVDLSKLGLSFSELGLGDLELTLHLEVSLDEGLDLDGLLVVILHSEAPLMHSGEGLDQVESGLFSEPSSISGSLIWDQKIAGFIIDGVLILDTKSLKLLQKTEFLTKTIGDGVTTDIGLLIVNHQI